jgi:hypothetical protein
MSFQDSANIATTLLFPVTILLGVVAWRINNKLKNIQDVVEIFGSLAIVIRKAVKTGEDETYPYLHLQNVGTRIIYLDHYIFNGKKYKLNGQVLASTYSQAESNYYWIELPTNDETHVSVNIQYRDTDNRTWKTEVIADRFGNRSIDWRVQSYPKKQIK